MIEHEIKKIIQAAEMIKAQVPEAVDVLMILGTTVMDASIILSWSTKMLYRTAI